MAKIGQFVTALVPFQEDDGRSKPRPVLVPGKVRAENGDMVYIAAARYSSVGKCRGGVEVVMTFQESLTVGLDKEAVLRFSRDRLVAFLEKDIRNEWGHYTSLPKGKQRSIENAAKSLRLPLV